MPIRTTGDLMSGTSLVARIGDQALAGPLGSLDAYLDRVSRIPVLSREEERALAERFRSRGDLAAARQLVLSHLRFVVHIARGYSGYGLRSEEHTSELQSLRHLVCRLLLEKKNKLPSIGSRSTLDT